ncbi:hypothetical protein AAY473_036923 [Plecturocebus cupreus]
MIFEKEEAQFSPPNSVAMIPSAKDNPQLYKACNLCPTGPSSGQPLYLELPVAPPSMDADQAVGGEFGPTKIHTHVSHSDLKQIKADLGKFSDDPDKYMDVPQGLGQSFKLD